MTTIYNIPRTCKVDDYVIIIPININKLLEHHINR
jgi:hypothetical protein